MNSVTIRRERRGDEAAREQMLDAAYGPVRFSKPSHKLREGRDPVDGLSFVAVEDGRVVGTVRLWQVMAGNRPAPAVSSAARPPRRRPGLPQAGHRLGADAPRHARGRSAAIRRCCWSATPATTAASAFRPIRPAGLWLPGPYEQHRLLGCEFVAGALDGARGLIRAPRKPASKRPLVAAMARRKAGPASRLSTVTKLVDAAGEYPAAAIPFAGFGG